MSEYCQTSYRCQGKCDTKVLGRTGLAKSGCVAPYCEAMVPPPAAQWTESTFQVVWVAFNAFTSEDHMHQGFYFYSFVPPFRYIFHLRWMSTEHLPLPKLNTSSSCSLVILYILLPWFWHFLLQIKISSNFRTMLYISVNSGIDALMVVDIKMITAVVSLVPNY